MRFGAPQMAIWLWVVPAVLIFYHISGRMRQNAARRFAETGLLPEITASVHYGRRKWRRLMLVLALLFLVVSLMRPQWGFHWQEVRQEGLDILIALDTSNSMLAEDVLPSRIDRAKLAIKDLVKKLHGDRIGLIVFSGTAFLQCPLTTDYNGFMLSLNDVDVNTIPVGGTSISRAIYKALESFEQGEEDKRALIIITDGEDLEGGVDRAIEKAKYARVEIFCLGIGSGQGELIPLRGKNGKMEFLRDAEGNVVKTKLQENVLQKIALDTGGMYVRATGAEFGLDLMYEQRLSKMQKKEFKSRMEKKYHERFQIPLALAVILFLLEPLVGDRKKEIPS